MWLRTKRISGHSEAAASQKMCKAPLQCPPCHPPRSALLPLQLRVFCHRLNRREMLARLLFLISSCIEDFLTLTSLKTWLTASFTVTPEAIVPWLWLRHRLGLRLRGTGRRRRRRRRQQQQQHRRRAAASAGHTRSCSQRGRGRGHH